ncbi:hypothetical protein [Acinetobacter junii]|uniref:hypothetical protein n=1 Tax=Acinetobacter junii TaxID=40215 RepID=UPI003AF43BD1
MSSKELIRLQARLPQATHENLTIYAEQQGISMNSAMVQLLDFALELGLQGEGNLLDSTLTNFKTNLIKAKYIIEEYIQQEVLADFENQNSDLYLEFIGKKFENLDIQERKILADLTTALANKKK